MARKKRPRRGTRKDPRLIAAEALDRSYSEAADFDRKQLDAWLKKVAVSFTRRTDFPKLGYLIYRLNEEGVPSVLHGQSFHAPILMVHKDYEDAAWKILSEKWGRKRLDDVDDDDPHFLPYADTQPDMDLWGE